MSIGLAPLSQTLRSDDFADDTSVKPSIWSPSPSGPAESIPSMNGGPGTELARNLPAISNGALNLTLETFNPQGPLAFHLGFWAVGDYGGYGGWPISKRFFYLVVRSESSSVISNDHVSKFFRTGVNTGSECVFVFVDISTDHRLRSDVKRLPKGESLFDEIESKAPVFLVSPYAIPKLSSAESIELFPIKSYETDINVIYEKMGIRAFSTRKSAVRFLRRINGYLNLKPSIFGLGANLNEVISDVLDRIEKNQP